MLALAYQFIPPPLLKHYVLSRWCCTRCGWFESGTMFAMQASYCPVCGQFASHVESCEAQTTRPLPFVSKPRLEATPDVGSFQVNHTKGLLDKIGTDARSRRRAGLKATGRPKKKQDNP